MAEQAEQPVELQRVMEEIRARARARRRKQENKDQLSRRICRKLASLPEYAAAEVVMFYVDGASEVRTRHFLPTAWGQGKRTVVPYCAGVELELFHVESLEELAPGTLRIPEPTAEIRGRAGRKVELSEVDLIVMPGVAFDRRGGRIGQGKGYYDKLLATVPAPPTLVALAFECQLVDDIPMSPHDVYVDKVITEKEIYERKR